MQNQRIKNIFYFDHYGLPIFAQTLKRADINFIGLNHGQPDDEVDAILADAHAYQVTSGVNDVPADFLVTEQLLERTPSLLLVSTIGAGYDTVDIAACTARGILVVNQSGGGNAQAVAEHMLGMMLCLSKRIIDADRNMRRQANVVRGKFTGRNALEKTVGIIGFGNIGQRLAAMCQSALKMRVLIHTNHQSHAGISQYGYEKTDLKKLLSESDFVAVCCALNDDTRNLIDAREFALMQPHAYFITAARGGIHNEAALTAALQEGRIAGAGVDVWDQEPPPLSHPLLQMDNVIATPHIGGATVESRIQASQNAALQILDTLDGQRPPRLLNPQAWPLYCERFQKILGVRPG